MTVPCAGVTWPAYFGSRCSPGLQTAALAFFKRYQEMHYA